MLDKRAFQDSTDEAVPDRPEQDVDVNLTTD